jgi:hypothetical protein
LIPTVANPLRSIGGFAVRKAREARPGRGLVGIDLFV